MPARSGAVKCRRRATTLLVLGDSLSAAYGIDESEGWVHLMAGKLEAGGYPHRVINASVSGETSEGGLNRLPKLLERHQPEWVLLELGGNDGLRGYPLSQLEENLTRAIERIRASGAGVILLGMQIPPNYGPLRGPVRRAVPGPGGGSEPALCGVHAQGRCHQRPVHAGRWHSPECPSATVDFG